MIAVCLESPYAGDIERNLRYARAAVRDCLQRGESAYGSHLLFTQAGVLRDEVPEERELGIRAGFVWGALASKRVFYADLGWSRGMLAGLDEAKRLGQETEVRSMPEWAGAWDPLGQRA
jgi:hypothetical protein